MVLSNALFHIFQFEDFANHNAFELLAKYSKTHLVFNDDIQVTQVLMLLPQQLYVHFFIYILRNTFPIWELFSPLQGTTSVVLAGLIASLKLVGGSLAEHTFLFLGAGEVMLKYHLTQKAFLFVSYLEKLSNNK